MKRLQYKVCRECGSHLDHGETCDCGRKKDDWPESQPPYTESEQSRINRNDAKPIYHGYRFYVNKNELEHAKA